LAYMKRFKVNLDTLLSACGKHILCSSELADAVDKENITGAKREAEIDKFKLVVFLKRSDFVRYDELNTELMNSAHLGRDEYPTSATNAMDIMVRRSEVFNTSFTGSNRLNQHRNRRGGLGGRGGCGSG